MADIELVIKTPESIIEHLKDGSFGARKEDRATLVDAVMNGTPLPKGHGRIIDESKIHKCGMDFVNHHVKADAPTIIEADKEEE